eukprot:TRINITY_DN1936_c3_g1_i1.p1 TRINITY_DN1936_c3_g1~~TRINITY_DN1936_c3_g1_i1.p1  ORF type:complete len:544 (-),score=236.57 TRINITY_DN1936_c3_g1_i1:157-1788(-)
MFSKTLQKKEVLIGFQKRKIHSFPLFKLSENSLLNVQFVSGLKQFLNNANIKVENVQNTKDTWRSRVLEKDLFANIQKIAHENSISFTEKEDKNLEKFVKNYSNYQILRNRVLNLRTQAVYFENYLKNNEGNEASNESKYLSQETISIEKRVFTNTLNFFHQNSKSTYQKLRTQFPILESHLQQALLEYEENSSEFNNIQQILEKVSTRTIEATVDNSFEIKNNLELNSFTYEPEASSFAFYESSNSGQLESQIDSKRLLSGEILYNIEKRVPQSVIKHFNDLNRKESLSISNHFDQSSLHNNAHSTDSITNGPFILNNIELNNTTINNSLKTIKTALNDIDTQINKQFNSILNSELFIQLQAIELETRIVLQFAKPVLIPSLLTTIQNQLNSIVSQLPSEIASLYTSQQIQNSFLSNISSIIDNSLQNFVPNDSQVEICANAALHYQSAISSSDLETSIVNQQARDLVINSLTSIFSGESIEINDKEALFERVSAPLKQQAKQVSDLYKRLHLNKASEALLGPNEYEVLPDLDDHSHGHDGH